MEPKLSTSGKARRDQADMSMRDWILVSVGLAVVAGLIVLVLMRSSRSAPDVPGVIAATPAAASSDHNHEAELSVRRMTAAELRTALDRGEALALDVRDIDSYSAGHIPGSMHIPLNFVESQVPYLPRGKTIVAYCTWPAEESSARAALIMQSKGISNVAALLGGLEAWTKAGFPAATGTDGPKL